MARRKVGTGRIGVRTMLSAEPWTVSDCGSLNYLATGEVCEGDTIHDRQQPHDFVMELAADYDGPLRGSWRWQIYGGLAGEPAFGPTAYPHRPSAAANPVAPVSHHWLDATHIAFGVVTLGAHTRRWKARRRSSADGHPTNGEAIWIWGLLIRPPCACHTCPRTAWRSRCRRRTCRSRAPRSKASPTRKPLK